MRLRTRIILAVLMFIAGIGVGIAMQPGHFRVTRSATIAAPPALVFAQVNDFHKWEAWSPWVKIDPAAEVSYGGPEAGVGAVFRWSGNKEVGAGNMTIMESSPGERIAIALVFTKPFEATSQAEFTFRAQGDLTQVDWTMTGNNNFIGKVISFFLDCDEVVGSQFEKGLAEMKTVAEAAARQ